MVETYYDVLGVPADATQDEIRAAYRERVLETHPDRNDAPDAAEQFTRVRTAEEILSDETERARYDRLGHTSYRRLVDRFGGASGESSGSENGNESAGSNAARSERGESRRSSSQATERGADRTTRSTASSRGGTGSTTTGRERTDRNARAGRSRDGPSHHARQRARRQRATAEWWTQNANERDGSATTGARSDGNRTDSESAEDDSGSFSYTVHGWEGEVDLDPDRPPLDRQTAVTVAGVTLLYPVFVYASVAPTFSILVNLIVAACTFALVGYLLTMPRVAMVSFGLWSLLVPLGLPLVAAVDPASIVGTLIVGAFLVPFGYAIAVWWALRP